MTKAFSFKILCLIIVLFQTLSKKAYAYLDPGTGSYFFQLLIAGLIGGLFAIKIYWGKIKEFFKHIFRGRK